MGQQAGHHGRRDQHVEQASHHHHQARDRALLGRQLAGLRGSRAVRAMPNKAPRAAERSGSQPRTSCPIAAPATPVTITNTAVRSGTPPTCDDTVIANGVATERGSEAQSQVRRQVQHAAQQPGADAGD